MKLTRFRLEAVGSTEEEVITMLTDKATNIRASVGGAWDHEDLQIQTTAHGYWGFIAWRRRDVDA